MGGRCQVSLGMRIILAAGLAVLSACAHGLGSIHFADPMRGWAVGRGGTILRTEDGGKTWQAVRQLAWFESVYFTDTMRGWAVGWYGADKLSLPLISRSAKTKRQREVVLNKISSPSPFRPLYFLAQRP